MFVTSSVARCPGGKTVDEGLEESTFKVDVLATRNNTGKQTGIGELKYTKVRISIYTIFFHCYKDSGNIALINIYLYNFTISGQILCFRFLDDIGCHGPLRSLTSRYYPLAAFFFRRFFLIFL